MAALFEKLLIAARLQDEAERFVGELNVLEHQRSCLLSNEQRVDQTKELDERRAIRIVVAREHGENRAEKVRMLSNAQGNGLWSGVVNERAFAAGHVR